MTYANPRIDYQHALRVFIIIFVLLEIVFVAIYTSRNPGIVEALKFNFWYAVVLSLITTLYLSYSNRLYEHSHHLKSKDEVLRILRRNTIRGVKLKETSTDYFVAGFGYLSAPVQIEVNEQEIRFIGPKPFIDQLMDVLPTTED
jgi:hypothetical protein